MSSSLDEVEFQTIYFGFSTRIFVDEVEHHVDGLKIIASSNPIFQPHSLFIAHDSPLNGFYRKCWREAWKSHLQKVSICLSDKVADFIRPIPDAETMKEYE